MGPRCQIPLGHPAHPGHPGHFASGRYGSLSVSQGVQGVGRQRFSKAGSLGS